MSDAHRVRRLSWCLDMKRRIISVADADELSCYGLLPAYIASVLEISRGLLSETSKKLRKSVVHILTASMFTESEAKLIKPNSCPFFIAALSIEVQIKRLLTRPPRGQKRSDQVCEQSPIFHCFQRETVPKKLRPLSQKTEMIRLLTALCCTICWRPGRKLREKRIPRICCW